MRRKPVTRSEIRFEGWHITTLPVDAVCKDYLGNIEPIRKLWAPLLRSLSRASKRKKAVRMPDSYMWQYTRLCTCQQCGGEFYQASSPGRYCSDECAKASWRDSRAPYNAARVKARSEARAAARADRRCANPDCNKPLTAQRSTMKFCSTRCRVAMHRAESNAPSHEP